MPTEISILADDDITAALEQCIEAAYPSFSIGYRAGSYQDFLEPSIRNRANIFILQARQPIAHSDDLLFAMQNAGLPPVYILFEVAEPGLIRYSTTTGTNTLAATVREIFLTALKDKFTCRHIRYQTMLLNEDDLPSEEAVGRHESLMEILRGCNQQEFLTYREKFGLNLKDGGYYLFVWELMGVEFNDHESNKYIYYFVGEMIHRECLDTINKYNGGEVFYATPNLLCVILNDLTIRSEAGKRAKFEELIGRLAYSTANKVACRYLSDRADDIKGLRHIYERYQSEKSLAFFNRDMTVIRPSQIESRKRSADMSEISALLQRVTSYLHYDLINPALESDLHSLYFDLLKPAMSFTLYYSSSAAIYNAIAEMQYSLDEIIPVVNNSPNLLQFSSIEEQYDSLLSRIRELRSQLTRTQRMGSAVVLKAMSYITSNYPRDISVADISGALFVSKVYLSQVFKREKGMGVIKYLINYRIEQAKKLLRETGAYVYEISEKVGFHDFRHFSRTFKELTGFSPTEYRKQFRSKIK